MERIQVPSPADFHTHLRQGALCKLVTPHVRKGGFNLAYVMPNLSPPITTTDQAVAYRHALQQIEPDVEFLMTLFLSPSLTPAEIKKAKQHGIVGVKSYPRGVTTGSETGVESYERYYNVFEEMERQDMVLNLHGEVPSSAKDGTSVLNAEARFLKHLVSLHERFPKLRIVLEHATTKAAVETVSSLGQTVACTITVHHLFLTMDDVAGQPLNFCKPIAKAYEDRHALRQVIASGHDRFFLGSDSAPHPFSSKMPALHFADQARTALDSSAKHACAAGVYTSPDLLALCAHAFECDDLEPKIPLDRLADFASNFGRRFYHFPAATSESVTLVRTRETVASGYRFVTDLGADEWVLPFRTGQCIGWKIEQ